jgi:urea transport system ATP-binding protein
LRDKGEIAILLVEQYFDFAQELADRFAILDRGQVVASGNRAQMMEQNVRAHLTV